MVRKDGRGIVGGWRVDTKQGSVGNFSEGVPQLLKEGPNPTVYHIDVN